MGMKVSRFEKQVLQALEKNRRINGESCFADLGDAGEDQEVAARQLFLMEAKGLIVRCQDQVAPMAELKPWQVAFELK